MRSLKPVLTISAVLALALPAVAVAAPSGTAPDCRFPDTRSYAQFGRIALFTAPEAEGGRRALYGCHTDVGRARRLTAFAARASRARPVVFGIGDWVGLSVPSDGKVRAQNLRTGRTHSATAGTVGALAVNFDGTLAWVADRGGRREVRTKALRDGRSRVLGSGDAIYRSFLALQNDFGCAITWRVAGRAALVVHLLQQAVGGSAVLRLTPPRLRGMIGA
jgi:hypothetical protein